MASYAQDDLRAGIVEMSAVPPQDPEISPNFTEAVGPMSRELNPGLRERQENRKFISRADNNP